MGHLMIPIVSFVGKSGIGKTTLVEKIVVELKARGVSVAMIKHHAHTTSLDSSGKDSWRYAQAGADVVVVSSPVEVARFERVPRERTLAEIAAQIENVDLILTEGFKREAAPKIEVARAEMGTDLVARVDELIAVAADFPIPLNVPCFKLDDAAGLATFLRERFL